MAANETTQQPRQEPRGFGERTRGLAGEYAHEQGWGLDVEERTKQTDTPQDIDGGTDYEYGAQDFGDDPVNTSIPLEKRDRTQNAPAPAAKLSSQSSEQGRQAMTESATPQAVRRDHELKPHGDELASALKPTGDVPQPSTEPNAANNGPDAKE